MSEARIEPSEKDYILHVYPEVFEEPIFYLTGFARSRTPRYKAWLFFLYLFYMYLYCFSSMNVLHLMDEIIYLIAAIHFITALQWAIIILNLRLITSKATKEMTDMVDYGIYSYEEDPDDNHLLLKKEVADDWDRGTRFFQGLYVVCFISNVMISPIVGYYTITPESRFYNHPKVSPYMPHVFYSPFDQHTALGWWLTYLVDFAFWGVGCSTTLTVIRLVLYNFSQLKLHLKVLNYSLLNIQTRAARIYSKRFGVPAEGMTLEEAIEMRGFREVLLSCLKANIRHHQALSKYFKVLLPFLGPMMTVIFSVATILVYAALIYLMLQPLPFSFKMKYFGMLISELCSTMIICLYGEDIVTESSNLFEALYGTNWYHYDKEFKQTLHIMMSNTREPLKYKAQFSDAFAGREYYAGMVRDSYSLTNMFAIFT